MAQLSADYVLSTPGVYIDDELWAIVPNSFKDKIPGEASVSAASSGGGNVEIVVGLNAEKLVGEISFELYNTPLNRERVETLGEKRTARAFSTVRCVDGGYAKSYSKMILTNEPDVQWRTDGKITVEMKGKRAA